MGNYTGIWSKIAQNIKSFFVFLGWDDFLISYFAELLKVKTIWWFIDRFICLLLFMKMTPLHRVLNVAIAPPQHQPVRHQSFRGVMF